MNEQDNILFSFTIIDTSDLELKGVPEKDFLMELVPLSHLYTFNNPLPTQIYEIWRGCYGSRGQGDHGSSQPEFLGRIEASSFKIACVIYEHISSVRFLQFQMMRGDKYIEDIHFGTWNYIPETNSNAWAGKYYPSKEEALKSCQNE